MFKLSKIGKIVSKATVASIDLEAEINKKINEGKSDELLMIVPTNRKTRILKKEFISQSPEGNLSQIFIETLSTITKKILASRIDFIELSEAVSSIFIERSASAVALKYFTNFEHGIPFGTLERIKNVISEYKRHGITSALLRTESEKLSGSEKLKAIDIADIYEEFLRKCSSLSAYETGDIYTAFLQISIDDLGDIFRQIYPRINLIIVNGFDEFTKLEIEILDKISSIAGSKLYINFDYFAGNQYIFANLDICDANLKEKGFNEIKAERNSDGGAFNQLIKSALFNRTPAIKNKKFKDKIGIIRAGSREEEIKLIARKIKEFIAVMDVQPHQICVVFNIIKNYSQQVADTFAAYGIPINLTDRTRLDQAAPVSVVINYLEILESNYFHKNISRAVSSGFADVKGFRITNLISIARELKVIAGKNNWLNEIKSAIDNFDDEQAIKKAAYEKALVDFKGIVNYLEPFEQKLTPADFYNEILKFIQKLNLHRNTLAGEGGAEEENIKALTTFIVTLEELIRLMELELGRNEKHNLKFYLDQLRTAGNWARFNIKERSDRGVLITSIDEIRGLEFDYLFIAGMNDGDFPTKYEPEIFFSGSFKRSELLHLTEQRYRFYQALSNWNKKLYLSYSMSDSKKDLVPSSFLDELKFIFEVELITRKNFERGIYSAEEMQINAGLFGKNNFAFDGSKVSAEISPQIEMGEKAVVLDELRRGGDSFSPFNGYILSIDDQDYNLSDESKKEISHLIESQFSVSQFELYAKCPFKYFVERVLNLQQLEEPDEDIEAFEIGNLLHDILFEFYIWLRNENIFLPGCPENEFKKAKKRLFKLAREKYGQLNFKSHFAFYTEEKLFGFEGRESDSILGMFIESERAADDGFIPSLFEIPFGQISRKGSDPNLFHPDPIEIEGVKLRGKIDRIDINREKGFFNIIDYKSGKNRVKPKNIIRGIDLQMPIYMIAAQEILEKESGLKLSPFESLIYSLKFSEKDFGKKKLKLSSKRNPSDKEIAALNENLFSDTKKFINDYSAGITGGVFLLSNLEDREETVCKYCGLNYICRK